MLPAFLAAAKQTEIGRAVSKGATRQGRAQAQSWQGFRSNEPVWRNRRRPCAVPRAARRARISAI